jgi:YjjG family noncanonical pyrimidine nucleotidase
MRLKTKIVDSETAATLSKQVSEPCYQWLLFDADGTLFDFERAEGRAFRQTFEQLGASFVPEHLEAFRSINQSLWKLVEKGEVTPGVVKMRRFELFAESAGLKHSPESLAALYVERLATCSELLEGAEEALGFLARKYKIALLTNGLKQVQRGRLAGSTIGSHISEVVISEEIGFAKPAKEFFEVAFERLGNPRKREALMIGDGWASDIVGAAQYGIDACWYNPGGKPRPTKPEITREIASLQELVDWLEPRANF